jgi:hypothetical protein
VIVRCITTTLRRKDRNLLYPWRTMTPSAPWIAARQDIHGMEQQFRQPRFFLRWQ